MTKSIFVILFIACHITSLACINEKKALLSGKHIVSDGWEDVPEGRGFEDTSYYKAQLQELDMLWKTRKNIDDYSDYGVYLVYLGRYKEAKNVFQEIEKTHPGRYATAANIGTIYELLGNNDSALYWIKEAVRIDPSSHMGSEWLHVKILEAKIKGDAYVNSQFLLGTTFGNDVKPVASLNNNELNKLRGAIFYQLNERISFIKPQDKIVGLLLFELGNITALTKDVTAALRNYDKAVAYGFVNDVLKKRYEHFLSLQQGLKNEYENLKTRPWDKIEKQPVIQETNKKNTETTSHSTILISTSLLVLVTATIMWRVRKNK